jgi:helicase required for RNAi-mediated heterochromatin assembly 1
MNLNILYFYILNLQKLNVSLFERLIELELPFSMLTQQRRMRPEIRELLTPIYDDVLTDHKDVEDYPDVPGFYDNLFFFDHQETEANVQETMSKINKFEATMCAKFANYLVKGGMEGKNMYVFIKNQELNNNF